MKNQEEKSLDLRKEEKIQGLVEAIKKHCKTLFDVEMLIIALTSSCEYMGELHSYRHDYPFKFSNIAGIVRKHGSENDTMFFEEIRDTFISGMLLSGHVMEGNELIEEMADELHAL